ncbi:MAG: DUF262 domain-containing protein [Oceanococcus sp.]|nr:MAG: DUF262 domain-containing protein [Oceanococcus sp.]
MKTFESNPASLKDMLGQIVAGKIQLPDFQRGWVWDDNHIRDLLVSVSRSFPIGAVMLLETGGEVRFQIRPVEHVDLQSSGVDPEFLILDGQQRLTSLTQVLKCDRPVETRDEKGKALKRFYYIDIERALANGGIEEALIGLDENKQKRSNFGRDIDLDLSTREDECRTFHFPLSAVLNKDPWEATLHKVAPERFGDYMSFRELVIDVFNEYQLPVIKLLKSNTKEAVCLVFEKVNTGGVPLSVFELVTASFAAEGFNLRDHWFGSKLRNVEGMIERLKKHKTLKNVEASDFLQCVTLIHTRELRLQDLAAGKTGKSVAPVSMKRVAVLNLPLESYRKHVADVEAGFVLAAKFLKKECFFRASDLPYRTQLVPLAAVLSQLQNRWLEPLIYDKVARWFWCGALGELYGGAVETRSALDVEDLLSWILDDGPTPRTISDSSFQAERLDTLRTKNSAAYKAVNILLMREGAKDFFWKATVLDLDADDVNIDIHHIFPVAWCDQNGIHRDRYNAIVNKTPISYKANRMVGGNAPSHYLGKIQDHKQVQLDNEGMDDLIATHRIDPHTLRLDDFDGFYESRKSNLLSLIGGAMGKTPTVSDNEPVNASKPMDPELARMNRDVDQLERFFRQHIESALLSLDDDPYKNIFPSHIRDQVERRIAGELKKNPARTKEDFADLSKKLEWLDLMECCDIMCQKALWPAFEPAYQNQAAMKSKFSQLGALRNTIRHSREMTEVVLHEGRAAIAFFRGISSRVSRG